MSKAVVSKKNLKAPKKGTELTVAENNILASERYQEALESSVHSVSDLQDYFAASNEGVKKVLPQEKQRYVVYLRKSTDDESKQVRSLEDQRKECLKLAQKLGVSVRREDILEESASAKTSGNRPVFDSMLFGFRTGKYHGLIAWSPDRISRNMKEAGEVIEMIDHEEIQSLHFPTYHFDNSPNGKMMLGIIFATSKQYSDKLSVDVKRGTDGNALEGKYSGSLKKGYYVDANRYFVPDGSNWSLLRKAVDMRLYDGKTYDDIAAFLNKVNFTERKYKDEAPKPVNVTKQKVYNMFADSFYCGLYKHGDNLANLVDLYNFVPLMTPDEYIQLNADIAKNFSKKTTVRTNNNKRLEYGLLNGKVICDYCDKAMKFQHHNIKRGENAGKWVVSFYCNNKSCLRHNTQEQKNLGIKLAKSIRAKYVLAGIEWHLRHLTKKSARAYRMYKDALEIQVAAEKAIAQRKLSDAKRQLRENEKQYAQYQEFQVNNTADYKKYHAGKLEEYRQLIALNEAAILENEAVLTKLKAKLPTEEDFYELVHSKVLDMLSTTDIVALDMICNEFVVNLRAGNDATSVIQLKKPYDSMVDLDSVSLGSGGRI